MTDCFDNFINNESGLEEKIAPKLIVDKCESKFIDSDYFRLPSVRRKVHLLQTRTQYNVVGERACKGG